MERDARGKAADAVERRARQRDAAARAQQALTPEAIEAERKRQVENAALIHGGDVLEPSPSIPVDGDLVEPPEFTEALAGLVADGIIEEVPTDLSVKLAEAVQPVLDAPEETDEELVGKGIAVFQWLLVKTPDNEDGEYQLGIQIQVDEQPPGGMALNITTEMLDRWRAGVGLQKNRVEHKRFAAGIIERAVELAALETGNNLIFTLEQLMQAQEDGGPEKWDGGYAPTETAVGEDALPYPVISGVDEDDGPFKDAPSEADEVAE